MKIRELINRYLVKRYLNKSNIRITDRGMYLFRYCMKACRGCLRENEYVEAYDDEIRDIQMKTKLSYQESAMYIILSTLNVAKVSNQLSELMPSIESYFEEFPEDVEFKNLIEQLESK